MARTVALEPVPVGNYPIVPVTPGAATITPQAVDSVNGMSAVCTGREVLVFLNPTAGAITVTINSVADQEGRTADITAYSVPAAAAGLSGVAVFGRFPPAGWKQADGNLYFTASAAGLMVAVLELAPI